MQLALFFFATDRRREFLRGDAGTVPGYYSQHCVDHPLRSFSEQTELGWRLPCPQSLESRQRLAMFEVGGGRGQRTLHVGWHVCELDANAPGIESRLADVVENQACSIT